MSHEIVPVDEYYDMDPIPNSPTSQFMRIPPRPYEWDWEPYDSERLPETLASGVQRFLRVANLVESEEPRTAYLCRFYTFEEAHRIDCTSTGRGVRQFKTSLLQKLEKENDSTIMRRVGSDAEELKRVYHAYKEYIITHGATTTLDLDNSDQREKLINARTIASVLYEVLQKMNRTTDVDYQDEETGEELLDMEDETHKRNSNVDKESELIVDKSEALEDTRLTPMSQGKAETDLETQERLNKVEKKIQEMELKLKDVDFWTSLMQNLFPDQMPPSMKANQTENINNDDKLSL